MISTLVSSHAYLGGQNSFYKVFPLPVCAGDVMYLENIMIHFISEHWKYGKEENVKQKCLVHSANLRILTFPSDF